MTNIFAKTFLVAGWLAFASCNGGNQNLKMATLLGEIDNSNTIYSNPYSSAMRVQYFDSLSKAALPGPNREAEYNLANAYLESGNEEEAISRFGKLLQSIPEKETEFKTKVMKFLGISWMRLGERKNCISNHGAESCIYPISGGGIHADTSGSNRAIAIFETLLKQDTADLEVKWLLNIAYMTVGGYPQRVPENYLIPADSTTGASFKPFYDIATKTGLNTNNLGGGSVVEDFNNDGYLDVITSSWSLKEGMHYFKNNGDGTFRDIADSAGIGMITGGLNLVHTDYNNDGFKDVLVLRGAWMNAYGRQPNSLLRNNGDNTFTDVTEESGLLSFRPTQTATWADFNNDGWLDLFVGNETTNEVFPCELYMNNQNGTFTEASAKAGVVVMSYVKGVTSGDYNNDGLTDLFISSFSGAKMLFKNTGTENGIPIFKDVSQEAGIGLNHTKTFSTWFWDYDNDGWLDILVCGYKFANSLAYYSAAERLQIHLPDAQAGKPILFRNKQDGTFENVSEKMGLDQVAFAMSSDFGDVDNDGYLDFYLGTGNPHYASLIPNKMFRNVSGKSFEDITTAARVGNLQKGHGISMADIDNDGDIDIHIDMGGAFDGDAYQNSLFLNPGQNQNRWIKLDLEGVQANKAAIGARINVFFNDNGEDRVVCRVVTTGSSFGSNPLAQHIGLGQATKVSRVEIRWPGDTVSQVYTNLSANTAYHIKEGATSVVSLKTKLLDFVDQRGDMIVCPPI